MSTTTATPKKSRADQLIEEMTTWLVDAIEAGAQADSWRMPWQHAGGDVLKPTNVKTGNPYRGGNRWSLALTAMMHGLGPGPWGTFNQWKAAGCPVIKGERALAAVAVPIEHKRTEENAETGEEREARWMSWRRVPVFHASQVEGWEPAEADEVEGPDPIDHAEQLVAAWIDRGGMVITYGGDRAYYSPGADKVNVPHIARFHSAEHYYATVAHEAGHWTGHPSRLARDMVAAFGDDKYAAEELVAELTAATIAAHLGIETATRDDHAAYLAGWVRILKQDPRHLWTVAGKAEAAADYLLALGGAA